MNGFVCFVWPAYGATETRCTECEEAKRPCTFFRVFLFEGVLRSELLGPSLSLTFANIVSFTVSNHIVAVVAGHTVLPMAKLPSSVDRAVFEGFVDHTLMVLREDNFVVNDSRAPSFLKKYGPLVAPAMTWTVARSAARAAFAQFVRETNAAWRNPALNRLSEDEVLRAPFGKPTVWPLSFRESRESSLRRGAVGGLVMDANTARSSFLGRQTSRGTRLGPPTYYEPQDAAEIEAAFSRLSIVPSRPPSPIKQEPASVPPPSRLGTPSPSSVHPLGKRLTRSSAAAADTISLRSSTTPSPPPRPSKRPRLLGSSPPPAPLRPRAPVARHLSQPSTAGPSVRLPRTREYIGALPPDLAGFLVRRDDDLVDASLPTSSARLELVVRFVEPPLTPYSRPSSALAAREFALQRWEALGHHVRQITFLAREVVNLASAEEELTGRPFGAPLEDPRAAHAFLPSAGARRFSELPAFASAYLTVLEGVYLAPERVATPAAPALHSPEFLGSSPPPSRAPTPAAIAEAVQMVDAPAPSAVPARTGSEADETIVEEVTMADAA